MSKVKIYYISFLILLAFEIVEARRRRGGKGNNKNQKNKTAVNLEGPMELMMCGVRIVVTLYLGVIF